MKYQIFITILLSTLALSVFAMKMKAKADIDPCHGGTDKTCSGLKGKDGKSAGCKWGKVGKATTDSCSTKAVEAPKPSTPTSTSAPTTAASFVEDESEAPAGPKAKTPKNECLGLHVDVCAKNSKCSIKGKTCLLKATTKPKFVESESESEDARTACVAHKKDEKACKADKNCSFKGKTCLLKATTKPKFVESESEDARTVCVAHKKNEKACKADKNCSFKGNTCLLKATTKPKFVETEDESEGPAPTTATPPTTTKVDCAKVTKEGDCKDNCAWVKATGKCGKKRPSSAPAKTSS